MVSSSTPPALIQATRNSTLAWQGDLQSLFHHAKDRFPDVIWELLDDDNGNPNNLEEVWGHKAVVYARAPPSFQARYFSFRPPPPTSPGPYSSSPTGSIPAHSSLSLGVDYAASISRSPSPFHRPTSPSSTAPSGALLRLPTSINPTLFSNELEYLYTGKGFGEAFEFLFDAPESTQEGDAEEARVDKLRKDLVFMWRSRLYSDVKIALTGNFSSSNHDSTTAVFSSHKFMLVSRSPYFHTQLIQWGLTHKSDEPLTVTLPSPPFTPASLHFTLGFIYTGTLVFSHRTFDLDTAFHIMRSATYLSLDTLYDEVQARIVQEMMHGLFHAFLEFSEYERITGGKWGIGGCRCRQCARRAPRVLEFALMDDVKNPHLERGSRRALVGLFGEGWCTPEFSRLPQKTREGLVRGLAKRTTPLNVFPLLFASHDALRKLNNIIDGWADIVRDMVLQAQKVMEDVLCSQAESCFDQAEWMDLMHSDGARFEDSDRVEWVMDGVRRGISETNAGVLYQTIVSSILLRAHPTENDATLLPTASPIRGLVEQTRMDIIRWLRKRWVGVKQEGGFDSLDGWALKEISHEIEVPVDDLFGPAPSAPTPKPGTPTARHSVRASTHKPPEDTDSVSMHSLRTSVLNRNTAKPPSDAVKSSSASVKSTVTKTTLSRPGSSNLRPDSKMTPHPVSSSRSSMVESVIISKPGSIQQPPVSSRRSHVSILSTESSNRPRSLASSVKSTQTRVSSQRKTLAGPSTLRPVSSASTRPTSAMSATSDGASTAYETAKSEVTPSAPPARPRRMSSTSTTSTVSVKVSTPRVVRSRPPSNNPQLPPPPSPTPSRSRRAPPSPVDSNKLSPTVRRSPSSTSLRSTTSTTSTTSRSKKPSPSPTISSSVSRDSSSTPSKGKTPRSSVVSSVPDYQSAHDPSPSSTPKTASLKRKTSTDTITESSSAVSAANTPTVNNSTNHSKKGSTLSTAHTTSKTPSSTSSSSPPPPSTQLVVPRGSTLEIGIPCIISSKKARFRAYARYIGEVEGEAGPWVGVEVPMNDAWDDDKMDGQQWNDGTWGGIRYFDIGNVGAEWEYGEDGGIGSGGRGGGSNGYGGYGHHHNGGGVSGGGGSRKKRMDWVHHSSSHHYHHSHHNHHHRDYHGLKREGDQLSVERAKRLRSVSPAVSDMSGSETRGLFVRPQQVLYVVDAVA